MPDESKTNFQAFREIVETVCGRAGWEKKKIADGLGVTPTYLWMLLNGKRDVKNAMLLRLRGFVKDSGLDLGELMEGVQPLSMGMDERTAAALRIVADKMGVEPKEALSRLIRRRAAEILEE